MTWTTTTKRIYGLSVNRDRRSGETIRITLKVKVFKLGHRVERLFGSERGVAARRGAWRAEASVRLAYLSALVARRWVSGI